MRSFDCPTCGQSSIEDERADERHLFIECRGECPACLSARVERHEAMALFTPAPTQLAGQLNF